MSHSCQNGARIEASAAGSVRGATCGASRLMACLLGFGLAACAMAQSATTIPGAAVSAETQAAHTTHAVRRSSGKPNPRAHTGHAMDNPSEAAAQSPRITLQDGTLTVDAENADLSAILNGVAHVSGMKVDGNAGNARVFGVYGPGNPRQVLTELLDGVGYNFMMVGDTAKGTPSQLLLTAKAGPAPATPLTAKTASASEEDDAAEEEDDREPPGPGAVMHVPPSVAQQADDSRMQQRVQQNLQRLQQMHDAMEQQQQNQPQ